MQKMRSYERKGGPAPALAERALGLPVLLTATVMVIVYFWIPRSMADPDIWWHLRNAQLFFATHHFMARDVFSFTASGAPWMNHEWIAEIPFYLGWLAAGPRGVQAVTIAITECVMVGIFITALRKSHSVKGALVVTILAALLSTISFGPRTLLFGWLCLILELLILDLSDRHPRLVWALPALYAVWVNTHGSWVIGLVLLVVYIGTNTFRFQWGALYADGLSRERLTTFLSATAASICVLFINPYGWRLVAYPFNLAFHQKLNVANVEEWKSVDFHSARGLALLASLFLLALWQLRKTRAWRAHEVAFLAIGIYSAFNYSRFLFLFSILAAPILAASFPPEAIEGGRKTRPLVNAGFLFVLACFVYGRHKGPDPVGSKNEASYPTDAVPAIAAMHLQGHMLNEYNWGGYLIWHLPDVPVFVDSRVDIFEYNGTFKDYLDIIRVQDTLALLKKYDIRYVFFEKDTPLVYLLQHAGGWKVDYDKNNIVLLERMDAAPSQ